MNGRRIELPHNSPEQVDEYLLAALEVVARLKPDDDLRVAFFEAAVNLISAKNIQIEQVAPGLPQSMVIPRGM